MSIAPVPRVAASEEPHTAEQIAAAHQLRKRGLTLRDAEQVLAEAVTFMKTSIREALEAGIPADKIISLVTSAAELGTLAGSMFRAGVSDELRRADAIAALKAQSFAEPA